MVGIFAGQVPGMAAAGAAQPQPAAPDKMVIKTKAIKITRGDDKQKVKTNLTTIIEKAIYMRQDKIFY